MPKQTHVAVAVIRDPQGRVLIARRAEDAHQGGKLEFPGGKVEPGESVPDALQRELFEELGIQAEAMQPLIKINHHYTDKSVCLDVWQVLDFAGQAYGKEGQPIFWLPPEELNAADFPAANVPIITALSLPVQLMISPDLVGEDAEIIEQISKRIERHNAAAVVLRLPRAGHAAYARIAEQLVAQHPEVHWQIHSDSELAKQLGVGLHLSSKALFETSKEQLSGFSSLSASIHNMAELRQAEALGIGFAVLGPVQATKTHPHAGVLGWNGFTEIANEANIPLYALGGIQNRHVQQSQASGAQGIAGISLFAVDE